MRTLIDIPDRQIAELANICKAKDLTRAEAVRRAIDTFIERNKSAPEQAFGLWAGNPESGQDYQERMRHEW